MLLATNIGIKLIAPISTRSIIKKILFSLNRLYYLYSQRKIAFTPIIAYSNADDVVETLSFSIKHPKK